MFKLLFLIADLHGAPLFIVQMDELYQNKSVCELSIYEEAQKLYPVLDGTIGKDTYYIKDRACEPNGTPA